MRFLKRFSYKKIKTQHKHSINEEKMVYMLVYKSLLYLAVI
jgi:hypothetical protein